MNEKMTNIKNTAKAVTLSGAMLFSGIGMAFQPACAATNPAGAPKKGDVYVGKAVAVKGWDRNKTRNAGAKLKINGTLGKNVKYIDIQKKKGKGKKAKYVYVDPMKYLTQPR